MPPQNRRRKLLPAALAALVAVIGSGIARFGHINLNDPSLQLGDIAPVVGALLILAGGWAAVRALASALSEGIREKTGEGRAVTLAKILSMAGFTIVVLWSLSALGIGIDALLLGGALTGIILGIAAQQTLGNIFAGLVLLVVRPFMVGEETVVKSTLGEYKGQVGNIGLFYVTIQTDGGRVDIPNAVALASAVGPGAAADAGDKEEEMQAPDGPEQPPG